MGEGRSEVRGEGRGEDRPWVRAGAGVRSGERAGEWAGVRATGGAVCSDSCIWRVHGGAVEECKAPTGVPGLGGVGYCDVDLGWEGAGSGSGGVRVRRAACVRPRNKGFARRPREYLAWEEWATAT